MKISNVRDNIIYISQMMINKISKRFYSEFYYSLNDINNLIGIYNGSINDLKYKIQLCLF